MLEYPDSDPVKPYTVFTFPPIRIPVQAPTALSAFRQIGNQFSCAQFFFSSTSIEKKGVEM